MVEIVDTHQHLWDLARHAHSWCGGIPRLNRSFVEEDYRKAAAGVPDGFRIVQTVHVEAAPDEPDVERETDWLLSLARSPESHIAGLVAGCRPERPDFDRQLERLAALPEVKGLRRVLHTEPDALSRQTPFRDAVRKIGSTRLVFDLCVRADQLPIGLELVRGCPDTRFVLDHCGVPDIKGGALEPWRSDLNDLAACPNVVACKISGLVAYADPSLELLAQVRPFVDHALASFGPDRVLFGGDWPVCLLSCALSDWVRLLDELTRSYSEADRSALFASNARRVYGLGSVRPRADQVERAD